jgi:DNA-directed RNA polymerase specialized sigma24 family protein
MSKEQNLYGKDNWLHGWTGSDMASLNPDILTQVLTNYYPFSKTQARIYLSKYGYTAHNALENLQNVANDISLKVLFEVAKLMSTDKYTEQGKIEPYIRTIVERMVIRFVQFKMKHDNYENPEILALIDDAEADETQQNLETWMKKCEEEIRDSLIDHAVKNLDLLFRQKFENKSIDELAVVENTSVGGIKSRLRLARKMLQDCINQKKLAY